MKKILKSSFFFYAIILFFVSCKKEGAKELVLSGNFPANALTCSPSGTISLTVPQDTVVAINFNWLASDYGTSTLIGTYTLQLDIPSDSWATPLEFRVSRDTMNIALTGKTMNDWLTVQGFVAGTPGIFLARVKSDITQYNGAASSIASTYSNIDTITATTHATIIPSNFLYVVGGFEGWDFTVASQINEIAGHPHKFAGFVNFPVTSSDFYFKYTSSPDWAHTNYGNSSVNGTFTIYQGTVSPDPAAMAVASAGYYYLTADLNTGVNTWTATKTTWSILGDATPGGWTTDTPLSYDPTSQTWTVTAAMKTAGSFKFRANAAWVLDFGVNTLGKLAFSDNPFLGYDATVNNISVPADSNYTITLDLHSADSLAYSAVKN